MKKKDDTLNIFLYHDIVIETHPEVYDPAEDTFLLLETLHIDSNDTILELGTGCGIIALDCACKGTHTICTDINPFAVQLTRRNIERNLLLLRGSMEIRQGNLFSVIHEKELFNVIIFNPPYLPTKKQEKVGGWFDIATDGGQDGLRVTKRFIQGLKKHLLNNGRAYFIFSSLSNRLTLEHYLKNEKLSSWIVARRKFEGEELDVYCVSPAD
ncbi:putative S-adenosylmethionine-dependent methyltransferase [uncultured archaeon]|nr:putative S-adenosylmethionine-dependent methyltransferase [uncultured archaeon]